MNKNNLPAWDLTDLYQNIKDAAIDEDLLSYKNFCKEFAEKYKGKLAG